MISDVIFDRADLIVEEISFNSSKDRRDAQQRLDSSRLVEICEVNSGNGFHRVLNRDIPCSAGDLFVVNADIPHGYFVSEQGGSMTVSRMFFDAESWFGSDRSGDEAFCYGVFKENPIMAYAMLNTDTESEIDGLWEAIKNELEERQDEWENAVKARLSLLLIVLGRYINGAIKEMPSVPQKEWRVVATAINAVMSEYGDSTLTLETVASRILVSSSRLSRLFSELIGVSFSEYVRNLRLGQACKLLRDTELTVEEIVALCGLKDIPSFYKGFNSYTGMTPNTYRTEEKFKKLHKTKGEKIMVILSEISANLQAGKAKIVKEMVQQAIDEGVSPETILKEGLLPGMNVVGEKFKNNEIFVPEVLIAARAMKQGADLLKPLLVKEGVEPAGKVCLGTVHGDLHDIGKNIVKMMLEGKGFEVIDLGTDVPAETFVNTAKEQGCDIICCSALLTTTMGVMGEVVKEAEKAGIRDKVKIMVGGAPVSEEFCRQIGADAYTSDAASCADLALELCK